MSQKSTPNVPNERIIPITIEGEGDSPRPNKPKGLSLKNEEAVVSTSQSSNESVAESAADNIFCSSISTLSLKSDIDEQSLQVFNEITPQLLPNCNVTEKIIIVLDQALDDNYTNFEIASGKKCSPLFMMQHAVKVFLHNKSFVNNQHEYALVVLNENSCSWVHNFTSAALDIIHSLQLISECEPEDIFDFNSLLDLILKHIELDTSVKELIPPLFIYRTVLIYGRSYSIPQLKRNEQIDKLLNHPYFTFDVVMTHEPPSSANNCSKIFKALQEIDTKGNSLSFSVARNAAELHVAMAKILSHPLQRPHQVNADYTIKPFI